MKVSYVQSHKLWSENNFKSLFCECLNWDHPYANGTWHVDILNDETKETYSFKITPVAGKKGVDVLDIYCKSHDDLLKLVVKKLSTYAKNNIVFENLMIITGKNKNIETWFHEYKSGGEYYHCVSMDIDPKKISKADIMMLFISQLFYDSDDEKSLTIGKVSDRIKISMKSLGDFQEKNQYESKLGKLHFKGNSLYLNKIKIGECASKEKGIYQFKSKNFGNIEINNNDLIGIIAEIAWSVSTSDETKKKIKIHKNSEKEIG